METKSPLTAKPLRNPGQSVDQEISNLIDEIMPYCAVAIFMTLMAGMEWFRWYRDAPPNPILWSVFAAVLIVIAGWKWVWGRRKLNNLRLGRDGEKAVGQFLDSLRSSGAEVFHDVPGINFNVDHVIIHPTGVYIVETKTWSKPLKGEAKLVFNGENITRFGKEPERNPIVQAKAAGNWLSELIQTSTGKKVPVRSVVVFPGWFIEPTAEAKSSAIWVLNPKALPTFINNSAIQLTKEDVKLIAYHISRYVRAENEKH